MKRRKLSADDFPLPKVLVDEDFKHPVAQVGRDIEKAKDVAGAILHHMAKYYVAAWSDHHCGIIADLYLRQMYHDQTNHEVFSDESMSAAWQEAFQRQATHRPSQELVGGLLRGMMYFSADDADLVAGAEKILKSLERGSIPLPILG